MTEAERRADGAAQEEVLWQRALAQVRDALVTLQWASDGWYEDEAQVALDAVDWIEARHAD